MTEFLHALGISGRPLEGLIPVTLIFLVAAGVTWWFIPHVRGYAIEKGLGDKPNARRLNKELLPNLGGLTIFFGVIAALVLAFALKGTLLERVQVQLLAILLGGALLLMVGFIDDQFELPPSFRMIVHFIAAGLLVVNGIRIDVPWLPPALDVALTIFWVVGITNAVNFMDGIDGLVGGLGFIASSCLLAISAQFPERAAAVLVLAAVAGGCLGFLRHNFNPSRIIIGDAGAYFVGYTLAAVSILGTVKVVAAASLIAPLFLLSVPIVDMTQVVIRRLRRRVSVTTPGKDHLHHQLMKTGLSQRRSVLILWAIILTMNVIGMIVQHINPLVIVVTAVGIMGMLAVVARVRVSEAKREAAILEAHSAD
jgi:UDP-GlcNAc:undecaprenyl-phosphate/decaprenyl-phosphate GlcNAc-1-phosphate transferase